jgi:hypothetical protein
VIHLHIIDVTNGPQSSGSRTLFVCAIWPLLGAGLGSMLVLSKLALITFIRSNKSD